MGVLQEIIREATAKDGDVPRLLRLCLLLGKRLGHTPLTTWVQHELEGYPSDAALPAYREFRCLSRGLFENMRARVILDIPLSFLPEDARRRYETADMRDSVGELTHLLSKSKDHGGLQIPWAPELFPLLSQLTPGSHCVRAWSEISVAELAGAIDQIKSRVLAFALDIEQEAPDAGEISGTDPLLKEEKLTQIFNTNITGAVQNLANGGQNFTQSSNTGIPSGDLPALLTRLSDSGVPEKDLASLKEAIEADKEIGIGATVKKWMGDLASRAAVGAAEIGLDKVTAVVMPALTGYFGPPSQG
jgi:hypothetical protein